ncbi:TolC family protein [Limnobaculum parvum]|uniref:TolC family protein n=1 Tax=Limnobaculum parvum TaxID=2172103 RepID=A0A2Y9TZR0_9GAMM|nr:TolC family protein [Limnobaculum parvum]AWH88929.1 hypothetical protein HYN51_10415 [Limnobaculum parvum]
MKMKQLALLTLSLSVTVTTAMSAQVDDKLLQALQPGRRAGAVNQPPPPAVKPKAVDMLVAQTEPVMVMPTPVSATPAREVTPAIVVPPAAPVATVGRDGHRWSTGSKPAAVPVSTASSNKGWVQETPDQPTPEPVRQPSGHDNQVLELMDIDATDNAPKAVASSTPAPVVVAEQNLKQTVATVTVGQPAASVKGSDNHDTEQLAFTDISDQMDDIPPASKSASSKALVDTRPVTQSVPVMQTTAVKPVVGNSAETATEQDILNWVVTDTSLTSPEEGQGAEINEKAFGYATKLPVAGKDTPSIEFVKSTVRQALNFSPEIRNAQAAFTAAKYDVDEIKGTRWPQVKVGANSPVSSFGSGSKNNHSSDIGDTSGSVSVTTTVYDFGKTGSGIQSAEELSKSSLQLVKLTRNQIAYQTIEGLLELNKFQKDIKVAKAYEKRMLDLVDMLSQITQTDKGRGSELVQARSKLLQAQTNVQQLESSWRDTQIKMTRLLGREVQIPENLQWDDSALSTQTILTALDHHPQIQRAKADVQASLHKADAIKSSSYPNINWVVSKSSARDSNGDEQAWYTGVNVEWDLFTGGSASASQAAAVQRAQATQMQFETTVLELKYKIRSMIQSRDSAFERAKEFRALSSETDRVRNMFYEQWYYLGKRSLLDVLTAENDHFNNQISAINNEFDGYTANISIMTESAMLLGWLGMPSMSD